MSKNVTQKKSLLYRYKKPVLAVAALTGSLVAIPAHAAIDVAPLVADITANKIGMETIALAILGILAFIFGIKLLRRVLS